MDSQSGTCLIGVKEAARRLGVSVRTVWSLVALGRLRSLKVSPRARRFDPRDLDAFVESLRAHAAQRRSA